jgi:hypothetical protein
VPIYGAIRFRDRTGREASAGVSVGEEYEYRSYIEGGTEAAAIWTWRPQRESDFPRGLPVEMNLRVFRTYKGDVSRGIIGAFRLRNPKTGAETTDFNFLAKEFALDRHVIPLEVSGRKTPDGPVERLKLFGDVIDAEKGFELTLSCLAPAQFFGVAKADVYILARERSFALNFVKGLFGIWLMSVVLIAIGVFWSTFLRGPVALLASIGTLIAGYFSSYLTLIAIGRNEGGGPLESLVKMINQSSISVPLDEKAGGTVVVTGFDYAARFILSLGAAMFPDFSRMTDVLFVAEGYDIPWDVTAIHVVTTLGIVVPLAILGTAIFRTREVAK